MIKSAIFINILFILVRMAGQNNIINLFIIYGDNISTIKLLGVTQCVHTSNSNRMNCSAWSKLKLSLRTKGKH